MSTDKPIAVLDGDFPTEPMQRDASTAVEVFVDVVRALGRLNPANRQRVLGAAWVFFVAHTPEEDTKG